MPAACAFGVQRGHQALSDLKQSNRMLQLSSPPKRGGLGEHRQEAQRWFAAGMGRVVEKIEPVTTNRANGVIKGLESWLKPVATTQGANRTCESQGSAQPMAQGDQTACSSVATIEDGRHSLFAQQEHRQIPDRA